MLPSLSSFETFQRRVAGDSPAGFDLARTIPVAVDLNADEETLWAAHQSAMRVWRIAARGSGSSAPTSPSLLDLKVELARRLLSLCRLCWLRCPVDRLAGEVGACGLGEAIRPYQDFVHLGEELELIPTHAIYLAGCNYRCAYCSDWTHVEEPQQHPEVRSERLSRSIEGRRREGVASLSFIGGLPDVSLPGILRALQGAKVSVPVVWNSNMSATPEAHDLLEGVVDAYVADLKYGGEGCAKAGSAVKGSLEVARRNLLRVHTEAYLIVRHLVLPGHVDCCALPTLDWLAEHLPGVRVNLMDQYMPVPEVAGSVWDRRPSPDELSRARRHAEQLSLDLTGPGGVVPPEPAPSTGVEHVAGFESLITIAGDGEVVVENLSPELARVIREVADETGEELIAREEAGRPWLDMDELVD